MCNIKLYLNQRIEILNLYKTKFKFALLPLGYLEFVLSVFGKKNHKFYPIFEP